MSLPTSPTGPKPRTSIALQIVGMMIAGMLLSQLITVGIVLFLPPQSNPGVPAGQVAALLAQSAPKPAKGAGIVREATPAEPVFAPDRVHRDAFNEARLAALMKRPSTEVRFYFLHGPRWVETVKSIWRPPFGPGRGGGGRRRGPPPPDAAQVPAFFSRPASAWLGDPDFPFFGRFVAAARNAQGQWIVVRPSSEPLLDEWQLRMLLWIAGSAILIAPAGYLFARRITAPLASFATAARRLGSDPNSPPVLLDGPAELGVAADAFNDMQLRLRRYVADRTAMFSAISHDLRTPLARTRFKIERAPEPLRASIARDLDQMEAMIASVLTFIRDGASGARKPLDLSSLLETLVNDATDAGGKVTSDGARGLVVSGDAGALKRLFANLVSNAVAYGGGGHVTVRQDETDAVVEIQDDGPGLSADELERVFDPFYRSDTARNLDNGGVGLGLAIARSIAREHGGEVTLEPRNPGLSAVVRLPLDTAIRPN